jgi:hypothetical protein
MGREIESHQGDSFYIDKNVSIWVGWGGGGNVIIYPYKPHKQCPLSHYTQ